MSDQLKMEWALRQMAIPDPDHPLPPAGLIWWRAEIARVRRSRARSARPVACIYAASCLVAAGVALLAGGPAILQYLAVPACAVSAAVVWKLHSAGSLHGQD
jgi:hypothetical protein